MRAQIESLLRQLTGERNSLKARMGKTDIAEKERIKLSARFYTTVRISAYLRSMLESEY